MKKTTALEQVTTPDGSTMALVERDGEYVRSYMLSLRTTYP
jgi:hypothetical protein